MSWSFQQVTRTSVSFHPTSNNQSLQTRQSEVGFVNTSGVATWLRYNVTLHARAEICRFESKKSFVAINKSTDILCMPIVVGIIFRGLNKKSHSRWVQNSWP